MTINELARILTSAERYKSQSNMPQLPNGSLPPPGHVNPYCTPGMDITGMKTSDFKIIPVNERVAQKVRDITLEEIKKGYGMSAADGSNPVADLIKGYVTTQVPVKDRINTVWTLEKIHMHEVDKIFDFIESRVPGWQAGMRFDTSILDEYKQGIDTLA